MKKPLVFTLTLATSIALAQEAPPQAGKRHRLVEGTLESISRELQEYCKTAECRKDTHFTLKMQDGSSYEFKSVIDPPVVQPNIVTIYPGEKLYIEADLDGNKLVNLKQVSQKIHPEKTISMEFSQMEGDDETGMILIVSNPFKKHLRYEIGMMTFDAPDIQYTSSCPVIPEGFASEHWPFAIFQLAFAKMRLLDDGPEAATCK